MRRQLVKEGKRPGKPASSCALDAFEAANLVRIPAPLRAACAIMNGADEFADAWPSFVRFWAIEEWRRAGPEYAGTEVAGLLSRDLFICADHLAECVHYAIEFNPSSTAFGHVFAIGATRLGKVAANFDDFIACVIEDRDALHCYG